MSCAGAMFRPFSNLMAFESPGPLVFGPVVLWSLLVLPSFGNSGPTKQFEIKPDAKYPFNQPQ